MCEAIEKINPWPQLEDPAWPDIPKHIHQMWLGKEDDEMPPPEKYTNDPNGKFCQSVKNINSDHIYTMWSMRMIKRLFAANPDLARWKHFWENNIKMHIERCDFARLVVLYVFGGIYVDCDVTSLKSFNILSEGRHFWIVEDFKHFVWCSDYGIFNGVIAASSKHPLIETMLDYIMHTYKPTGTVMDTTGPVALGKLFTLYGIEGHSDFIVPQSYIINHDAQSELLGINKPDPKHAIVHINWTEGSGWQYEAIPHIGSQILKDNSLWIMSIMFLLIIGMIIWLNWPTDEKTGLESIQKRMSSDISSSSSSSSSSSKEVSPSQVSSSSSAKKKQILFPIAE